MPVVFRDATAIYGQSGRYEFDGISTFRRAGVDLCFALNVFTIALSHGFAVWVRPASKHLLRKISLGVAVCRTFDFQLCLSIAVAPLAFLNTRRPAALLGIGGLTFYCIGHVGVYESGEQLGWQSQQLWSAAGASVILFGLFRPIYRRLPDFGPSSRGINDRAFELGGAPCSLFLIHLPLIIAAGEAIKHMRGLGTLSIEPKLYLLTLASILGGPAIRSMSEGTTMRCAPYSRNQNKHLVGPPTTSEAGR